VTTPAPPAADVMPFREGEQIDAAALAPVLEGRLPGARGVPEVWQFGGGNANLTYLVRYASGDEYVLRRPPLGPVAPGAHDMGREYRVLSVLHRAFAPAPRAYLYCEDSSVIGAPFFVMERRRGVVVRGVVPPEFGGGKDPVANRRLSEVLIDTLVDFHRVDPAAVGLETLGRPEGFLARQVRGWQERWERAKTREVAAAADVARWLVERLPPSPPATLVHNDWRLDNMMVAFDDPGRAVAVFDWDMCTLGDPLADLGSLLSMWLEAGEDVPLAAPMPSRDPGFMTRAEAVRRYGERSGRDVSHVPYYYVFGIFKMAVIVQQIYFRWHRGQTRDARFAVMDQAVEGMLQLARARIDALG
jgi:aminoglycoside phosphotransferase (APT) family kinase protein